MDATDRADNWYDINEYDSEPDDVPAWKLCAGCHAVYVEADETFAMTATVNASGRWKQQPLPKRVMTHGFFGEAESA